MGCARCAVSYELKQRRYIYIRKERPMKKGKNMGDCMVAIYTLLDGGIGLSFIVCRARFCSYCRPCLEQSEWRNRKSEGPSKEPCPLVSTAVYQLSSKKLGFLKQNARSYLWAIASKRQKRYRFSFGVNIVYVKVSLWAIFNETGRLSFF